MNVEVAAVDHTTFQGICLRLGPFPIYRWKFKLVWLYIQSEVQQQLQERFQPPSQGSDGQTLFTVFQISEETVYKSENQKTECVITITSHLRGQINNFIYSPYTDTDEG